MDALTGLVATAWFSVALIAGCAYFLGYLRNRPAARWTVLSYGVALVGAVVALAVALIGITP